MSDAFSGIFLLVIIVFFIIVGPIVAIWALNTLFPILAIPLTFKTWFAITIVVGIFHTANNSNSKD